jgi:glucan phosphorylase
MASNSLNHRTDGRKTTAMRKTRWWRSCGEVQLVFAGNAYPCDTLGKRMIQEIYQYGIS